MSHITIASHGNKETHHIKQLEIMHNTQQYQPTVNDAACATMHEMFAHVDACP